MSSINILNQFREAFARAMREKHERQKLESAHPGYSEAFAKVEKYVTSYLETLHLCSIQSRRAPDTYRNFISIERADDLVESTFSFFVLARAGAHNPARRELRYLLEASMKYLYLDQKLSGCGLDDKLAFLESNFRPSKTSYASELKLEFDDDHLKLFTDDCSDLLGYCSGYVHPSKNRIEDKIRSAESGIHLGMDTFKIVGETARQCFRVFDISLVCMFHALGLGLVGDMFVKKWDQDRGWAFHKGRHVSKVSTSFDYKAERKAPRLQD